MLVQLNWVSDANRKFIGSWNWEGKRSWTLSNLTSFPPSRKLRVNFINKEAKSGLHCRSPTGRKVRIWTGFLWLQIQLFSHCSMGQGGGGAAGMSLSEDSVAVCRGAVSQSWRNRAEGHRSCKWMGGGVSVGIKGKDERRWQKWGRTTGCLEGEGEPLISPFPVLVEDKDEILNDCWGWGENKFPNPPTIHELATGLNPFQHLLQKSTQDSRKC